MTAPSLGVGGTRVVVDDELSLALRTFWRVDVSVFVCVCAPVRLLARQNGVRGLMTCVTSGRRGQQRRLMRPLPTDMRDAGDSRDTRRFFVTRANHDDDGGGGGGGGAAVPVWNLPACSE